MSNLSPPLVFFSTSAANLRTRRSRKSPWSIVPPGNWCEILSVVGACAPATGERPSASADRPATEPTTKRRRVVSMTPPKGKAGKAGAPYAGALFLLNPLVVYFHDYKIYARAI